MMSVGSGAISLIRPLALRWTRPWRRLAAVRRDGTGNWRNLIFGIVYPFLTCYMVALYTPFGVSANGVKTCDEGQRRRKQHGKPWTPERVDSGRRRLSKL